MVHAKCDAVHCKVLLGIQGYAHLFDMLLLLLWPAERQMVREYNGLLFDSQPWHHKCDLHVYPVVSSQQVV